MAHTARPRGARRFEKPPLEILDLVRLMEERGLVIGDHDRALSYLRHIGYYRLSAYAIPFREPGTTQTLRCGTKLDDIIDLYVFDRALRLLVMDAVERVEVAVRAAMTDYMATTYADSHWYVNQAHFRDRAKHQKLLSIVRKTCEDRLGGLPETPEDSLLHRSALEHYLTTYAEPELPPSWLMVETLTIGQLSTTFQNLARRADRTAVSKSLGLTAPLLESWLDTYVRVRNVSAHHGRLWNVGLGKYPAIPTSASVSWLRGVAALPDHSRKRLYPVLVSLQCVLDTVDPTSHWATRLKDLLDQRSLMNLSGMGVPEKWHHDEFWCRHLG